MLARFRFEYEWVHSNLLTFAPRPPTKRWYLFHDLVPIQAEVFSLAEAHTFGLEPGVPGYDGLRTIFLTGLDRVVITPWAPARPHPDADNLVMERVQARTTPLHFTYPNGRVWLHIFGDTALSALG